MRMEWKIQQIKIAICIEVCSISFKLATIALESLVARLISSNTTTTTTITNHQSRESNNSMLECALTCHIIERVCGGHHQFGI